MPSLSRRAHPDSVYCHRFGVRVALGSDGGRSLLARPLVVSILAILDMVVGAVGLVAAAVFVATGRGAMAVAIAGSLGAATLACAVGLWRLRSWGRTLQTLQACLGLLAVPFGTAISILLLIYFTRPGVKLLFAQRAPTTLTAAEIAEVAKVHRQYAASALAVTLTAFVVIMGVGILAAVAIPLYANVAARARVAKAQADVRAMVAAVAVYADHCGAPPRVGASATTCAVALGETASGEVPPALTLPQTNAAGRVAGPFFVTLPTPPVGFTPYRYTVAGRTFRLCTTGDGTTVSSDESKSCP